MIYRLKYAKSESNFDADFEHPRRKAIAIPSATLLSQEDRETLRSLSREKSVSFHMFPDCDAPGESLFMQLRDVLPGLVHHQLPVGCKDFGEAYSLEEKSQELRS